MQPYNSSIISVIDLLTFKHTHNNFFTSPRSATWWTLQQMSTLRSRWDTIQSIKLILFVFLTPQSFARIRKIIWIFLFDLFDRKKRWMRLDGWLRMSSPSLSSTKRKKLLALPLSSTEKMANPSTRMMNRLQKYGKYLHPVLTLSCFKCH